MDELLGNFVSGWVVFRPCSLLLSLFSSYFSCAPEIREPHKGNFVFLFFKCVFILMDELPSQKCNGRMKVCGSAVKLSESKLKNNSITGLKGCCILLYSLVQLR